MEGRGGEGRQGGCGAQKAWCVGASQAVSGLLMQLLFYHRRTSACTCADVPSFAEATNGLASVPPTAATGGGVCPARSMAPGPGGAQQALEIGSDIASRAPRALASALEGSEWQFGREAVGLLPAPCC